MTAIAFDTLSASKRLREAGMDERAAEAIVELVRQTARMPDISNLATKDDLRGLATKAELAGLATKAELQATNAELQATNAELRATKIELKGEFKSEIASLEARLSEKMRVQGWALIGGVAVLMTISTALIKLVP
jgi:hypothetical protein